MKLSIGDYVCFRYKNYLIEGEIKISVLWGRTYYGLNWKCVPDVLCGDVHMNRYWYFSIEQVTDLYFKKKILTEILPRNLYGEKYYNKKQLIL